MGRELACLALSEMFSLFTIFISLETKSYSIIKKSCFSHVVCNLSLTKIKHIFEEDAGLMAAAEVEEKS